MQEIFLASEVDAECDPLGDILIKGCGVMRMKMTRVAARSLIDRLREAADKSEAMPAAPKKEYPSRRRISGSYKD